MAICQSVDPLTNGALFTVGAPHSAMVMLARPIHQSSRAHFFPIWYSAIAGLKRGTSSPGAQNWITLLSADPSCRKCGEHPETGSHVALVCSHGEGRGRRWSTWEEVDVQKRWLKKVKDGGKEIIVDLAETFFANLDLAHRTAKAKAAWELVQRLTKLPPKGKKQIVCGQELPILTYGAELHTEPSEEMERLSAEWGRWVCGGWRGSVRTKIKDITGIQDLKTWMWTKRIRWAASVYGRALPALRETAEGILAEVVEPDAVLHWMSGSGGTMGREINVAELNGGEEVAASAAVGGEAGGGWEEGVYLGSFATVMDAELLGVARAWKVGRSVVAFDSQGAIGRLRNLCFEQPRSWIEELAVEEIRSGSKTVMWVKGHSGVEGNERADRKAKKVAWVGKTMLRPDIITPAGIRQTFVGTHIQYTRLPPMAYPVVNPCAYANQLIQRQLIQRQLTLLLALPLICISLASHWLVNIPVTQVFNRIVHSYRLVNSATERSYLHKSTALPTELFRCLLSIPTYFVNLPHGMTFQADEMEPRSATGVDVVVTNRGPQRWWLHKIGRADDPWCGLCEVGVSQNAAHLLSCPGVADGKGRKWEQIWEDPEWCEKLAEAVRG
ncbi:hypothetical protein EV426DRAFT_700104 [Tirmania nivea]|nr:hypothetical protein EV426DRAFT_700104 [Tirmania nivea]